MSKDATEVPPKTLFRFLSIKNNCDVKYLTNIFCLWKYNLTANGDFCPLVWILETTII